MRHWNHRLKIYGRIMDEGYLQKLFACSTMTSNKQTKEGNRQMAESILVVDDEQEIADLVEVYLQNEGYTVHKFYNAKDALNCLDKITISLALLDVMLPDGNGYEFLKQLREHDEDTPVIFLTACDEEVNIVMGLDIGGDDYITKPFRVRELISRINAILRRKGKSQDSNKKILKFKNISIHTLEARVFKNNEEIFLTSAEYKLLLILIQNKNMVLSRAQILEKLWDVTYDFINDNTLSVYIKRLREKIEDDSSKPQYILTVRGLGYKWNGSDDNENTI